MPVRGGDSRPYEVRGGSVRSGEHFSGYGRPKEPSSPTSDHSEGFLVEAAVVTREPVTTFKLSDMEKQTIVLEKAAPNQGFGIAVSGGLDNPHYETGDTSIIVSDVVDRSPAEGLLRINDVILSVNGVNVEGVEHAVAVEALKNSGYSVTLVILRKKPSISSAIPYIQEHPSQPTFYETYKGQKTVVVDKHPTESYGLSLGTILFIKDLDPTGPAGQDGQLEAGDVLLQINGVKVDDLSRSEAVNLMRSSPERLNLIVASNKDVSLNMSGRRAGVSETISMSRNPNIVEGGISVNGQDLAGHWQNDGIDGPWSNTLRSTASYSVSSVGRRSDDRDMDAQKDKKFRGEPHLVSFHRTGSSLGIQVSGGNAVGIYANAVKDGSPAKLAGLRVGDQILVANEIDFKEITREEAVLLLLSLPEEVSLLVQYKKSVYDRTKDSPGDSFYVKAQFQYAGGDDDELSFRRGEVFHVLDTMNGGTIGSWRAQRVLQSGAETEVGIIPNKCRAEQLAIARDLETKKGSGGKSKSGTLKRKDTKNGTAKKKQYQAADQLDESSFQLDVKYPAYERVVKQKAGFVRPVVLLGPIADLCRDKLMVEFPEKFTSPTTYGRFDAKQGGIKLSAVRENIESDKHSLLDVTPEGVEMLNYVGLEPIVIFMKPNNKQIIKDLRYDLTKKNHSARFIKKLYDQSETLTYDFPYLFTAVITLERNDKWYTDCVEIIKKQQENPIWLPETVKEQSDNGELVLQRPRHSVVYDTDQSGLDLPEDVDCKSDDKPRTPDEEIVAANATLQESEPGPVEQAYSVVSRERHDDEEFIRNQEQETDLRERDFERLEEERRRELLRKQEQREFQRGQGDEREFQRRQGDEREFLEQREEREFQRRQEEEEEFHRRQEEREFQRRQEEEREFQRRREEEEFHRRREEREFQRRQEEEREFQRRQEEREFQRRQEEEREFQRRQEEEKMFQHRQDKRDFRQPEKGREYQKDDNDYDRQMEQRKFELNEYEKNRRRYDDEPQREQRKPFIPPGVKVLPGALPPVVNLKKTDSFLKRGEIFGDSSQQTVQLRHVERRDSEAEHYDERIGVKVSDIFDVRKDFRTGEDAYDEQEERNTQRGEGNRYRSDIENDDAGFSRDPQDSRVVIAQDDDMRDEYNLEDVVRSHAKPDEAVVDDFDDFSSQQNVGTRTQTSTEYRTSYQVTKQSRNPVIDSRDGRRVEGGDYYTGRSRSKIGNVDEDHGGEMYRRNEEPPLKMDYESRVSNEPSFYDRRPPLTRYDDDNTNRRPPPPADDEPYKRPPPPADDERYTRPPPPADEEAYRRPPPPVDDEAYTRPPPPVGDKSYRRPAPPVRDESFKRSKAFSNTYSRSYGPQSSMQHSEYRRNTTEYNGNRHYNGDYQQAVPEAYHYGSTAYRYPATDFDDPHGDATSDFESVTDDEPSVVATARGYFTSRGGILTSESTGVSIYIPSGAIPPGIEQEIYFKVCNDNSILPPLDAEKGETLLSPLVMCGPHGTKFLKAVELRLPHSAAMTSEGWSFALNSNNDEQDKPKNYTVGSNSVSVLVDHF